MAKEKQSSDPCQHLQEQFVDALYGEMTPEQEAEFYARLADQPKCRAEFEKMKATLGLIEKPVRPDLPPDYWDRYWDKLEAALPDAPQITEMKTPEWQLWGLRIAAAAAILLIGFGIGRFFPTEPQPVANLSESDSTALVVAEQTFAYLEKSKTLLQGLVNADSQNPEDALDLDIFQQSSRKLVNESIYLRTALTEVRQPRLSELVRDLEIILSQLANLEDSKDGQVVEIIRDSVDRSAIFLKINIEKLHRLKEAEKKKKKSNRQDA